MKGGKKMKCTTRFIGNFVDSCCKCKHCDLDNEYCKKNHNPCNYSLFFCSDSERREDVPKQYTVYIPDDFVDACYKCKHYDNKNCKKNHNPNLPRFFCSDGEKREDVPSVFGNQIPELRELF